MTEEESGKSPAAKWMCGQACSIPKTFALCFPCSGRYWDLLYYNMHRSTFSHFFVISACLVVLSIANAQLQRDIWAEYDIGLIGDAETNPTFKAIKAGAQQAVHELELKYKLDITLVDPTPRHPDPAQQVQALQDAYVNQWAGVFLIPTRPTPLKNTIDFLVNKSIPVITVGRDVPTSMRTATWLPDEAASAQMATDACIRALGTRGGRIAVLTGDTRQPIQSTRLATALAAIEATPHVQLQRVYPCAEDLDSALATIKQAWLNDRDDQIDAWLFLGDWPLRGAAPLPWDTHSMPCAAIGALPPMLPYIQRQEVALLVAQDYYQWGYAAMSALIQHIHTGKAPDATIHRPAPIAVTEKNVQQHWRQWVKWNR